MAKFKFSDARITDIVAILDKDAEENINQIKPRLREKAH